MSLGEESAPRLRGYVDCAALRDGDRVPGIAVGRVQPAAAEIERAGCTGAGGPGTAAEPRPRFHNQAVDARVEEPPACRNSGRATADDHRFGIIAGHTLSATVNSQPTRILAMRLQHVCCISSRLPSYGRLSALEREQGTPPPSKAPNGGPPATNGRLRLAETVSTRSHGRAVML